MTILTERPSRRAALAALASAPALAVLPAAARATALGADAADDHAIALWERRHAFRQPLLDAYRVFREAEGRIPAWARPGPAFMDGDGSLVGGESGWPAIEGLKPTGHTSCYQPVRPGPDTLRAAFDADCAILGREKALRGYRRRLRELALRLRAKESEEERSGFAAADRAVDALCAQADRVDDEIGALAPTTPNAAAARILIEAMAAASFREPVDDSGAMTVAAIALDHLRPALRGMIKAHVDELLDNPDRRLGSCQAYVGDSDIDGGERGASASTSVA